MHISILFMVFLFLYFLYGYIVLFFQFDWNVCVVLSWWLLVLYFLQTICVTEMLCRSAKHLFQRYMHCTDPTNIAAGVAHFLNCLLSSCSLPTSSPYSGDLPLNKPTKKKNKKGKNKPAKDNLLGKSHLVVQNKHTSWLCAMNSSCQCNIFAM